MTKASGVLQREMVQADGHPVRDADLTSFVGYNMKRALTLIQADLTQVLADYDLRIISFSVLTIVVRHPGINQTQLAEGLKLERSNLVQIIDELSNRTLLRRAPIEGTRRSVALVPLPAGRRLWEEANSAVNTHEARVLSMLSAEERETLNGILRKIRDAWSS